MAITTVEKGKETILKFDKTPITDSPYGPLYSLSLSLLNQKFILGLAMDHGPPSLNIH